MSKITKLIKHPIRFFKDANKNREKIYSKTIAKKTEKEKKVKIITKEQNITITKKIVNTVIDNILATNINFEHEVALYFAGNMNNLYQIEQWLKPLEELNKIKKVIFIVRIKDIYNWLEKNTNFTIVYCKTIDDLLKVYEDNHFKCILYVNQGFKNFQSLINARALHVHINHGESDKSSTISNQSKAYDYIFIVGDAAYDKYNLNLIKKDMSKYIKVGRPQLDFIEKVDFPAINNKIVILYAPTWEATHESMNFTSLNDYGMAIVQQIINNPEYHLIYKPHPNTGSRDSITKELNSKIIKLLNNHDSATVVQGGDINSIYEHIDLAIFDNSAVAIDYLQVDKPMLMTDIFHKIKDRNDKPSITKAARLISENDIFSINMLIKEEINKDTIKQDRNRIKKYFLGEFNYYKKESTTKFINEILKIIKERDQLIEELKRANEQHKKV